MAAKRICEEIVTDQISCSDWTAIFDLNLNDLYRIYFQFFKENDNQAMDYQDVIRRLQMSGKIKWTDERISFNRLSGALRSRGSPFRVRAISKDNHRHHLYKVVRVVTTQSKED